MMCELVRIYLKYVPVYGKCINKSIERICYTTYTYYIINNFFFLHFSSNSEMSLLVAAAKPAILKVLETATDKKLLSDTVSKQFVVYGNQVQFSVTDMVEE